MKLDLLIGGRWKTKMESCILPMVPGFCSYDGVNWKLIETEAGGRSLAMDDEGVIYVGGAVTLGIWKRNRMVNWSTFH